MVQIQNEPGLLGSVRDHSPESNRLFAGPVPDRLASALSVLAAELGADEFLVMGFESSVEWRPAQGSGYAAAQLLEVEEGYYENGAWKRTVIGRTSQSDYAGASVSLPARGGLVRVKLMRY